MGRALVKALGLVMVAGLVVLPGATVRAQPEKGPQGQALPEAKRSDDLPRQGAVSFTHRGVFRFRPELLLGGDLGTGTSGVPAPIGATAGVDADASALTWASLRLRYEAGIHVGPDISVHVGLDAFDNLVLGSTHENAGGDLSLGLLRDAQAPPSSGRYGWRDALSVRQAWARWMAIDTFDIRAGRMVDHFGLGLQRNGGDCSDCDFGTVVDRVSLGFGISGFRLDAAWEFTAVGVTSEQALAVERQAGGQPKELGLADDVTTYAFKAGQYPVSAAERAERQAQLDERREWAIDWSVFAAFTDQTASSLEQPVDNSVECGAQEVLANGQPVVDYACVRLVRRDAFFVRPGFWLRAERRPSLLETIRIEVEGAALVGSIARPQRLLEADPQESKDFMGFGFAAELEYKSDRTSFGLDFGLATGDDGPFVGVLDGSNVVDPDDDGYATNDAIRNNRTITSFAFHRDYRVDLILFRQVLGAVTNALYVKPWIAHELLTTEAFALSARLDVLYAAAMRPTGTPGGGDHWGVEFDARIGLEMRNGLSVALTAGLLVPLDALENPVTGESPDPSFALRAIVDWRF